MRDWSWIWLALLTVAIVVVVNGLALGGATVLVVRVLEWMGR